MMKQIITGALIVVLATLSGIAPADAGYVYCDSPTQCIPPPCPEGCVVCVFYDDAGNYIGYIVYRCY